MAGRIRQDDIDTVRHRTDLVRIVQGYVALKKAGRNFSGLCPFHTEKSPSFSVSAEKGVFYCFGCGKGGDAFRFIQEIEGLSFVEAAERLASQVGITLRYEGDSPGARREASRRQALHRANERAAELYTAMLLDGKEGEGARTYLASRGLSRETVEAFGIGFSPRYPDFLLRRMARELSTEIIVEAGLATKDGRGQVRDRFRGRVMFPIHDLSGRNVGFGARLLDGDGPKYLNSPETPVYRKSDLLYNLHRAKADISKGGRAVVVEGYTDVIALHQAGITTAVATCGTALGEGHFRLLSKFTHRVVLSFDSDEAGARAAERAHGLFEEFGMEVAVLILPEGQDPADFATAHGGDAFERLADRAEPLVEYMLRRSIRGADASTPEGKAAAVRAGLPILTSLKEPVLRSQYAGRLADLVGVSTTDVQLELERSGSQGNGDGQASRRAERARPERTAEVRSPAREVEKEALKLLAQYPHIVEPHVGRLGEEHFRTARYRKAWALLRATPGDPAAAAAATTDKGIPELIAEVSVDPLRGEPTPSYAEQIAARLEALTLEEKIRTMRKQLEALNPVTESATFDPLFRELTDLTSRWRDAKARAGGGT